MANTTHCSWPAGDHLYRMNYQDFVLAHRKTGADITVAALPTDEKKATAFGLMKIDGSGRIVDFAEKPKGEALHAMRVDTTILGLDAERCAPEPGTLCRVGFAEHCQQRGSMLTALRHMRLYMLTTCADPAAGQSRSPTSPAWASTSPRRLRSGTC